MWETKIDIIKEGHIVKYSILEKGRLLTRMEVMKLWQGNETFNHYYNNILAKNEFEAYFWEHPPIIRASINETYEFVLVNSKGLRRIAPRPRAFRKYFAANKKAVTFSNLGGDAQLIVPTPMGEDICYTHLAQFVRHTTKEQQNEFWQLVGKEYEAIIGERKKWLSTSGLGVHWLHVRIDSRPKYYQYRVYANA